MEKHLYGFICIFLSISSFAQKKDYIPMLDTNKLWIEAMMMEFGDIAISEYYTETESDTLICNDTIYTKIMYQGFLFTTLREDTIDKKVYQRSYYYSYGWSNEILLYDFSMKEGDSINGVNWSCILYLDSIKEIEYLDKTRKTFYFHSNWDVYEFCPVWVEGMGSLAGIFNPDNTPNLLGMGQTELNCLYQNDELIYQSENSKVFGCYFEIDPYPPYIETYWTSPDIVPLNGILNVVVIVYDMTDVTVEVTLTSPNGNEYIVNSFLRSPLFDEYYYDFFQDFNNETGDWYVSKIVVVDEQNNVTEENYTFDESIGRFYFDIPPGTPPDTSEFKFIGNIIYPNPTNGIFKIRSHILRSDEGDFTITVSDLHGSEFYRRTDPINNISEIEIDISRLGPGVYILNLSNDRVMHTEMIIQF